MAVNVAQSKIGPTGGASTGVSQRRRHPLPVRVGPLLHARPATMRQRLKRARLQVKNRGATAPAQMAKLRPSAIAGPASENARVPWHAQKTHQTLANGRPTLAAAGGAHARAPTAPGIDVPVAAQPHPTAATGRPGTQWRWLGPASSRSTAAIPHRRGLRARTGCTDQTSGNSATTETTRPNPATRSPHRSPSHASRYADRQRGHGRTTRCRRRSGRQCAMWAGPRRPARSDLPCRRCPRHCRASCRCRSWSRA